ncbi:MAG: CDP-alcohol phosphatidyltransferase family protein [Ruminococcaceae bacterium]|nr:CDP-alcohol phosphatidyltransferase family protein [Oscillospiraceae bacterium]
MSKIFKREQVLTIPNFLSMFRILLIPVIIWMYCGLEQYYAAIVVLLISGLTDILDGVIARRCNMVSDFGKILDPIADKLTQFSVIVCLAVNYEAMQLLIALFVAKEVILAVMGYLAIRKLNSINSAKWYGKANTVLLYTVMVILILFPDISQTVADGMILVCAVSVVASFLLYSNFYLRLFRENRTMNR